MHCNIAPGFGSASSRCNGASARSVSWWGGLEIFVRSTQVCSPRICSCERWLQVLKFSRWRNCSSLWSMQDVRDMQLVADEVNATVFHSFFVSVQGSCNSSWDDNLCKCHWSYCSVLRIAILHQVLVQPVQDATEQAQDQSVGEAG